MAILFTTKGQSIQLGRELGRGGEGSVFEVPSSPGLVAKLYHANLDKSKQAKLAFMASKTDEGLMSYAAWPRETLHRSAGGQISGFLMTKIADRQPIHMLYSPAHRRQEYPNAAWDFLVYAARNTAAAFSMLHDRGHVVGDVNQGNVLVGRDAKVSLIDCDSFQVNANGTLHLCEVGVSHFTPPELQSLSSFDGVKRSANHDNFGLALLIFHTLFGGRHPFSGVPVGNEGGELEPNIKDFRYAYATDARRRGLTPPPRSIPVSVVPDVINRMLSTAFTEVGVQQRRPNAAEWVSALDTLRGSLKKCTASGMHIFPAHINTCPWCALATTGVVYFIDRTGDTRIASSKFSLASVWAAIESIQLPPTPVVPQVVSAGIVPDPLPAEARLSSVWPGRLFTILTMSMLIGAAPQWGILTLIGALIILFNLKPRPTAALQQERRRRSAALSSAVAERERTIAIMRSAVNREAFNKRRSELVNLRDEYNRLASKEQTDLQNLQNTALERQKHTFLDKFFIDSATIPKIGPAKKAALRSFGIETAADVNWNSVRAVKGFGDSLTRLVVDWSKSCERRFVFDPRTAVTEADKNVVRARIATQRAGVEAGLSAGMNDLKRFKDQAALTLATHLKRLQELSIACAKAQADFDQLPT